MKPQFRSQVLKLKLGLSPCGGEANSAGEGELHRKRLGKSLRYVGGQAHTFFHYESHVDTVAAAQDCFQCVRDGLSQDSVRFFGGL